SRTDAKGVAQPAFSRFYVYERSTGQAKEWLKVGPDSLGKTVGWMDSACTVDWKMQLTLAFTNPANRDRLLFFKDRAQLDDIIDAPDPVSEIAPIRDQLKRGGKSPKILAQEPELF